MRTTELLDEARRVLRAEADALAALVDGVDETLAEAVEALLATKGRIVVSGIGKSGHIGRKIAATLASTGAPSQFVHPAEANHGDLGMITPLDTVLMLSNSGETAELFPMIEHTRRFDVPLIGIASRRDSTLLKSADIALVLPPAEEACPMNLAPTTSTTMTLALGDALAIAVMVARGFTAQDFRRNHPGGSLGARLLGVGDLMHTGDEIPTVSENATMASAILEMTAKSFGVTGVVDAAGALVGVITDGDLRRNMETGALADLNDRRAGDVATRSPKTTRADVLAAEALRVMNAAKITALFVVEHDKPVGLIRIHDILRAGVR